jgi:hypothetical protein
MKVYEKKNFPRNPVDFDAMNKAGKLSFNNAAQRGFVWKNTEKDNRKSMLIDSMLRGLPVPAMYCNCIYSNSKEKLYDFVDGKQRTNTVIEFLNNQFKLVKIPLFNLDEDGDDEGSENLVDLNGKMFSELPEWAQSAFKSYSFTVNYFENMSQDDVDDMISRLNNGKGFTGIELTRIKAKSIEKIKNMGEHSLFSIALNDKAINGYTNEDIVIKTWAVMFRDRPSLETKEIRPMIEAAEITDEQAKKIEIAFSRILEAYNILTRIDNKEAQKAAKRLITRTHLISVAPVALRSITEDNVGAETFAAWVRYLNIIKRRELVVAKLKT